MAKSLYQFWINNGKSKIRLPVNPETLNVDLGIYNETVRVSDFGDVSFINKPGAKTYTFKVLLPEKWFPSCEYKNFPKPREIEKRITNWTNAKDNVQFIVTGSPKINMKATIESASFNEGNWSAGDLEMTITLQEYSVPKPRSIKIKRPPKKKPVKKVSKPRPKPKVTNKTYTVKSGDTLWGIAQRFYGNGLKWKQIWNDPNNKKRIIARDARNNRMPGHWIHIGFKLHLKDVK